MKKPKKSWSQRRLQGKALKTPTLKNSSTHLEPVNPDQEYLTGCGIIRENVEHGEGEKHRTHSDVRRSLGDEIPYEEKHRDICGYWTSKGRFVSRREGSRIAVKAGQASERCFDTNILSCDITWNAARKAA